MALSLFMVRKMKYVNYFRFLRNSLSKLHMLSYAMYKENHCCVGTPSTIFSQVKISQRSKSAEGVVRRMPRYMAFQRLSGSNHMVQTSSNTP